MTLAAGTRLGPYEIQAPLGAGGMGEVYRARDTRLSRDVAIKVLPQHLSANPEVRARFEREAKTISSLNHPHICVLHDVGREGDTDYLVMELVEGETLAQRLTKGPLPMPDVLRIGVQIADALDRAHRAGVIHRDLKPGNVMLTRSGAKLMDFGLARSTGMAGPAGASGATLAALTQSPTVATPLTAEGSLIGTFQYMSPEQLEGREADARSDLWAFGAMLYEMATGKAPFGGRSQASLIAAILEREPPPLSTVVPLSPPALERLIRACLAKDPEQRIQTAHDVKLQLEWIAEGGSQAGVPAPVAVRRRSRERLAWGIVAGLGVLALALGSLLLLRRPAPPAVTRFEIGVPRGASNMLWPQLSPDGRTIAMLVSDSSGVVRIWIRPFDSIEGHPLGGTEGASRPFWSPDSRFLAYIVGGKLRKAPVDGGPPTTIADASGGADGSWGTRGVILFDGGGADSIRAVPASGGAVRAATVKNRRAGDVQHSWPQFLPDGRHFLYIAANSASASEGAIQVGDLDSKTTRALGRTDGRVQYSDGYLLFPREGTLMAQPFDPRSLRTTGDPVPVAEHLSIGSASGHFSVAAGELAYRVEESADNNQLVWMDRTGHVTPTTAPPAAYRDLAISPDGRRVAVAIGSGSQNDEDIWVRDLTRGVNTRLTFGQGNNIWPVWSPDGSRIAYCSNRAGDFRVLICSAGGEGGLDSVGHAPEGSDGPVSWSPDGRTLLVTRFEGSDWNLLAFPAQGGGKAAPFVHTPYIERWAQFSPDGHWVAYTSNESGRNELYVTGYPGPSGKWQISTAGGNEGFWRGDGKELCFRAPDGTIMAAPIQTGAAVEVGTPVPLFRVTAGTGGFSRNRWAPTLDGQRFLVNTPVASSGGGRFIVVTHWAADLAKRK